MPDQEDNAEPADDSAAPTEIDSGAAPKPQNNERLFTQAEVDAIVLKAKRRVENKVRRETPATQPTNAQPADDGPSLEDAIASAKAEMLAELQTRELFVETIATSGLRLSVKQREILRARFNPADPDAIVAEAKELFPGAQAPAQGNTYVDPGAPSPQPNADRATLTRMTGDDINRLRAEGRFREELDRFRRENFGQAGLFAKRKKS